jgi:cell division control protein 6
VVAPPSPAKRRTRQSAPQIYEDQGLQHTRTRPSVTKVSASSTRIVQNTKPIQRGNSAKSNPITLPTSDDAAKENIPPSFATPSAPRFKDALSPSPATPRHRVRLGGKLLTPRSHRTASPKSQSVYAQARQLFTQSNDPIRLIGRDGERAQLSAFLTKGVELKRGGCMYISGPPGTGKSALVQETFQRFSGQDGVRISVINCVTTKSFDEIFTKLSTDLDVSASSAKRSKDVFSKLFTSKSKANMHLVLLDEIDSLLDGDCESVYSMFEWAMHRSSSLLLIGVANALDLTDRFLPRLKQRGLKPQLLPFLPYSAVNMSNIITQKLRGLLPADTASEPNFVPFVQPAAIQLIGKKIASQTGDLRKSFNLTRRTIDLIEQETLQKFSGATSQSPSKHPLAEVSRNLPPSPPSSSPLKPVSPEPVPVFTIETAPRATIAHVARLASSIFNNGTTSRLAGLNLQQKAVLCSLVANEARREALDPFKTPSKSAKKILTIKDLFERYAGLCQRDDGLLQPLKVTEFRDVVASLETLGLVHESTGRSSSLLTPSKTPSRTGRNADERQIVSAVSAKEMQGSLQGPGADLLQRLFDD